MALHQMLDGLAVYPALMIACRLTGALDISFSASFKDGIGDLYAKELIIAFFVLLVTVLAILRPVAIMNLQRNYNAKFIREPSR